MEVVHNINKTNINKGKEIYQCTTCDKLFNWDEIKSCWYGSHKDMDENPDKIKYYCSHQCYTTKGKLK